MLSLHFIRNGELVLRPEFHYPFLPETPAPTFIPIFGMILAALTAVLKCCSSRPLNLVSGTPAIMEMWNRLLNDFVLVSTAVSLSAMGNICGFTDHKTSSEEFITSPEESSKIFTDFNAKIKKSIFGPWNSCESTILKCGLASMTFPHLQMRRFRAADNDLVWLQQP